jgi:hypothetical protein
VVKESLVKVSGGALGIYIHLVGRIYVRYINLTIRLVLASFPAQLHQSCRLPSLSSYTEAIMRRRPQ